MDSHDIAYIAGLFDGEGCITIAVSDRSQFRPNPSPMFGLRLSIANQYLPVLIMIQQEFNGSIHKREGSYILVMQTNKAERFLQTVFPFLRIKKGQAELGLEFQKIRHQRKTRPRLTEEEIALYYSFYWAIRELNARDKQAFHEKSGELLGHPEEDNQQPSSSNETETVDEKAHRLTGEEVSTNKPDTSARPERDDIVGTA